MPYTHFSSTSNPSDAAEDFSGILAQVNITRTALIFRAVAKQPGVSLAPVLVPKSGAAESPVNLVPLTPSTSIDVSLWD